MVARGAERGGSRNLVRVGRIAGAHGVRGRVRLVSYTEDPRAIGSYGPLTDRTGSRRFVVKVKQMAKGSVIAEIEGVGDRNAAAALAGVDLFVARAQLPAPAEDEFYRTDLIGLAAELADGTFLGTVTAVENFGAGDVIEISRAEAPSVMVPFTRVAVPVVDVARGRLVVDPLPGLLEEAPETGEENAP